MEPILIFYGIWTIEVIEFVLGAGAPALQLILDRAGAADGTHLNPAIGTRLEANGEEWALKIRVSFDLQPFQALELARKFAFDPQSGVTATVIASHVNPAFQAAITLRLTARDPELSAHPAQPYDFTVPERVHPHEG